VRAIGSAIALNETTRPSKVETIGVDRTTVAGAEARLSNAYDVIRMRSDDTTQVCRSGADLDIDCKDPAILEATSTVRHSRGAGAVQLPRAGKTQAQGPWRDSTAHLVRSPLEHMQRLAILMPRLRLQASSLIEGSSARATALRRHRLESECPAEVGSTNGSPRKLSITVNLRPRGLTSAA
jgi:hypothetical protein